MFLPKQKKQNDTRKLEVKDIALIMVVQLYMLILCGFFINQLYLKKIIINNWEKRKGQGKLQMLGKDYFPK